MDYLIQTTSLPLTPRSIGETGRADANLKRSDFSEGLEEERSSKNEPWKGHWLGRKAESSWIWPCHQPAAHISQNTLPFLFALLFRRKEKEPDDV